MSYLVLLQLTLSIDISHVHGHISKAMRKFRKTCLHDNGGAVQWRLRLWHAVHESACTQRISSRTLLQS